MPDPITTSVLAGINTAFKLAEFGLQLSGAGEETQVFCMLVQRVRKDRFEAVRERREKADQLEVSPLKKEWVDGTISDIDMALYTIGKLVESARVDGEHGRGVTLKHRFEWVLKKKESFLTKQSLLATCHQSLSNAIVYMQGLQGVQGLQSLQERFTGSQLSLPAYEESADQDSADAMLRSPSARRPRVKQEYTLQAIPDNASLLSDEWRPSLSTARDSRSVDGSLLEPERTHKRAVSWEDMSDTHALNAAAAALTDVSDGSRTAASIADSLRSSSVADRRRRNEARFT